MGTHPIDQSNPIKPPIPTKTPQPLHMEATKAAAAAPHPHRPPPSTSDLMSRDKVIAGAAKSAASKNSDKIDKGRVAGAAADLLGAAKHYGKLEEKSFGKYLDKAEGYLHNYHASHSSAASAPPSTASGGSSHHEGSHSSSGSGSGYGDYIKLAQGLLKKH